MPIPRLARRCVRPPWASKAGQCRCSVAVPVSSHCGGRVVTNEQKTVRKLFAKLKSAPRHSFPKARQQLQAPSERGVYLIYSPRGRVHHVGCTPRAKGGIAQRLRNHLAAQSSFVQSHLEGDGDALRRGYKFACVVVDRPRYRMLLEAFAIGYYCPTHIGQGVRLPK